MQCNASWADLFAEPKLHVNTPLCDPPPAGAEPWSLYEPPEGSCELDRCALKALPADQARVVRLRCAKMAASLATDPGDKEEGYGINDGV